MRGRGEGTSLYKYILNQLVFDPCTMSQNKNDNLSEQIQGTWGISQYNFTDHVQPPRDFYK